MIECLESRIAPAGVVDILISGGNVTLKVAATDTEAQALTITQPQPGTLVIDPTDTTQLRINGGTPLAAGDSFTVDLYSGKLTASLGGGDDMLIFLAVANPRLVIVDLGAGNDRLDSTNGVFASGLNVKGGDGNDTVRFLGLRTTVGASALFDFGAGENLLTASADSITVGRDLKILGGVDKDQFDFTGNDLRIGGSLTVTSGAGADTLNFSPDGVMGVGKTLSLASLGGPELMVAQTLAPSLGLTVGGDVRMSGGLGNLTQDITGGGTLIGGNLVLKGATGPQTGFTSTNLLVVTGGVTFTAPAATQTVVFINSPGSSIGGNVKVTGGLSLNAAFAGVIGGGVTFTASKTAAGATLLLNGGAHILGNVTATLPSATDQMARFNSSGVVVYGKTSVTLGAGADIVQSTDSSYLGGLSLKTLDGADTVSIDSAQNPAFSQISGATIIALGLGADVVTLGGSASTAQTLAFRGSVLVDGGPDSATLTVGSFTTFAPAFPLKKLNIP